MNIERSELDKMQWDTLVCRSGLAMAGGEARRLIHNGIVYCHDRIIQDTKSVITESDFTDNEMVLSVKGKQKRSKTIYLV